MNNIRNSVTLIGHLGQDPEIVKTQNGKMLANLRLATNEVYRNQKGDKVSTTEWHRCVAWGKLAELVGNYCKKGKEVAVRGKLTYESYEDKEGVRRTATKIVLNELTLLGKNE